MDFSKIRRKIRSDSTVLKSLGKDVKLIVTNCKYFNDPSTVFFEAASDLEKGLAAVLSKAQGKLDAKAMAEAEHQELQNEISAGRARKESFASGITASEGQLHDVANFVAKHGMLSETLIH